MSDWIIILVVFAVIVFLWVCGVLYLFEHLRLHGVWQ